MVSCVYIVYTCLRLNVFEEGWLNYYENVILLHILFL